MTLPFLCIFVPVIANPIEILDLRFGGESVKLAFGSAAF
jgi:hypothetical protein